MAEDDLNLNPSSAFEETYETIDGTPVFKMLIDGKWRSSERGEIFDVHTPIDGSVIAGAQAGTGNDAKFACSMAKEKRGIRELPGSERIEIFECAAKTLENHRSEFIRVLQIETGKTAQDAEGEFEAALQRFRFTKEEASRIFGEYIPGDWNKGTTEKMAMVIREPVGVVAAIIPFNYPLFIAITKIAPGLLAGNSVVVKPSSTNPIASTLLARVLQIAGVPDGSINLITGKGGEAGDALVESEDVDMINFTGSTPVGKSIAQKAGMKRLHLELGGKAYALVLEDADLDLSSQKCVEGSLKFAGQRCDAVSAVLAMEPIADALVEKIVAVVDRWKLGDPRDESVNIGPVINSQAAVRINGQVQDAIAKGAVLLRGGKFSGMYFQPTVLDHVPQEAVIATEEVFGPVVTIIRCRDVDEALNFARQSKYGLESCVFTRDFYRMWRVAKALECGEVTINDCPSHGVGYFPFGGIKQSGLGREGIGYSIDEMTRLKTIVFNLAPAGLGKKEQRASTCKTGVKQ